MTPSSVASPDSALYRFSHRVFVAGLILKGLNAVAELIGGGLLLLLPFDTVSGVLRLLPFHLFRDGVSPSLVTFAAWYFLSHGALKAVVIVCLIFGKTWAYPLGIAVFLGFGIYQTWEYAVSGGVLYLLLDLLDALLIVLTAVEWRHAKRRLPQN